MRPVGLYAAFVVALSATVLCAPRGQASPQQQPGPPQQQPPAQEKQQPPAQEQQQNTQQQKLVPPAASVPLSIASVVRKEKTEGSDPRLRSTAAGFVDVMAGEELVITATRPFAQQARYEAQFDAKIPGAADTQTLHALAWPANTTTLVTRAPAVDSWQPRELRVLVDDGQTMQLSANAFPLRIAPAANAVIESISPTVVQWDAPIKVTGQGFFAPKEQIILQLGEITVHADHVSPAGDWFSATVPKAASNGNKYDAGIRDVSVTIWKVPAQLPEAARTGDRPLQITLWRAPGGPTELLIAVATLITAAGIGGLLYGLYRTLGRKRGLTAALLLDPETDTYSLARAQFFWWTTIIALGYLFLFYGHGLHQGVWNFPPLEGFAYTFMISLGTLLVAQATQAVKGPKGAGVLHPTPADLIVHGGVLAPERVQQVVWTVLAGVAFLWIIFKTYTTSTGLPTIPNEMLALMGISSAGYLGGKMARKAGPVIQRVEVGTGSVILRMFGQHLSANPRILIDGVELARENISTLEPDPDNATEFANSLKITVPDAVAATTDDWFSRKRLVAIINADTQRAEWELAIPVITDIKVGDPGADSQRTITASGSGLATGTVLVLPDGTELPLTPGPGETRATATTNRWPDTAADVVVRNAQMGRTTFRWTPAVAAPKTQTTDNETTNGTKTSGTSASGTTTEDRAAGATSPADDPLRRQADQAAEGTGTAKTE